MYGRVGSLRIQFAALLCCLCYLNTFLRGQEQKQQQPPPNEPVVSCFRHSSIDDERYKLHLHRRHSRRDDHHESARDHIEERVRCVVKERPGVVDTESDKSSNHDSVVKSSKIWANVLGIGGAKTGSTAVIDMLKSHKQVLVGNSIVGGRTHHLGSYSTELNFFVDNGPDMLDGLGRYARNFRIHHSELNALQLAEKQKMEDARLKAAQLALEVQSDSEEQLLTRSRPRLRSLMHVGSKNNSSSGGISGGGDGGVGVGYISDRREFGVADQLQLQGKGKEEPPLVSNGRRMLRKKPDNNVYSAKHEGAGRGGHNNIRAGGGGPMRGDGSGMGDFSDRGVELNAFLAGGAGSPRHANNLRSGFSASSSSNGAGVGGGEEGAISEGASGTSAGSGSGASSGAAGAVSSNRPDDDFVFHDLIEREEGQQDLLLRESSSASGSTTSNRLVYVDDDAEGNLELAPVDVIESSIEKDQNDLLSDVQNLTNYEIRVAMEKTPAYSAHSLAPYQARVFMSPVHTKLIFTYRDYKERDISMYLFREWDVLLGLPFSEWVRQRVRAYEKWMVCREREFRAMLVEMSDQPPGSVTSKVSISDLHNEKYFSWESAYSVEFQLYNRCGSSARARLKAGGRPSGPAAAAATNDGGRLGEGGLGLGNGVGVALGPAAAEIDGEKNPSQRRYLRSKELVFDETDKDDRHDDQQHQIERRMQDKTRKKKKDKEKERDREKNKSKNKNSIDSAGSSISSISTTVGSTGSNELLASDGMSSNSSNSTPKGLPRLRAVDRKQQKWIQENGNSLSFEQKSVQLKILQSMKNRRTNRVSRDFSFPIYDDFFQENMMAASLRRWVHAFGDPFTAEGKRKHPLHSTARSYADILCVSNEDLLQRPRKVQDKLTEFLGLDQAQWASGSLIDPSYNKTASYKRNPFERLYSSQVAHGLSTEHEIAQALQLIDDTVKKYVTPEDQAWFEKFCANTWQ